MPSFDVISKTDMTEVKNAIEGIMREISTRFDFKESQSSLELKTKENEIVIIADDTLKLRQVHELLFTYIARRKLETSCLDFCKEEQSSGNKLRQIVKIKQGIDQTIAKQITKAIKDSKIKVQCSIQGDELRISGKKRDDLQNTITLIKNLNISQPLQYVNFRN